MTTQTAMTRSFGRTFRTALAASALGLMATLVPLATPQASAKPVPMESGLVEGQTPTLNPCALLLAQIRGGKGATGLDGVRVLDILDSELDDRIIDGDSAADSPLLGIYRQLDCESLPGFPSY